MIKNTLWRNIKIKTRLDQVTLRDLIKFVEFADQSIKLSKKAMQVEGDELRSLVIEKAMLLCQIVSLFSNVKRERLENMEIQFDKNLNMRGELADLYSQCMPLIDKLTYEKGKYWNNGDPMYFKFKRQMYFIFELGENTVRQQDWIENYWSEMIESEYDKLLVGIDWRRLPHLLAVTAYKKEEVNTTLGKAHKLKEAVYKDMENLIEDRAEMFLDLPVMTAYKFMDCFFFSLDALRSSTQTYGNQVAPLILPKPKSIITNITGYPPV